MLVLHVPSIIMCVLRLKNYLCAVRETKCMSFVFIFPAREMMRMVMIWIVTRYHCCCHSVAWGTAAANGQRPQSRGQGGGRRTVEQEYAVFHSLWICFKHNRGYNPVALDFSVRSKCVIRFRIAAMQSRISS